MRLVIKAKCFLKDTNHLLRKFGLEKGGEVQEVIDMASLRYSAMYMPMNSGNLIKRSWLSTDLGSGRLIFPGPYAHYLYYGEVYGPNIPIFDDDSGIPVTYRSPKNKKKYPTGRALQYSKDPNPHACSHWWEVAKANHIKDILEEARKAVRWYE